MRATSKICFHSGEAVPKNEMGTVMVQGVEKPVCCIGCQAVASLVLNAGLDRFYEYRNKVSGKPVDNDKQQKQIAQWQLYDKAELLNAISRSKPGGEQEAIFLIEGIYCSSCTWLIEHVLKKHQGVLDVQINPVTGRIRLNWHQTQIKLSTLLSDIAALGYSVQVINADSMETVWIKERRESLKRLLVAGIGMMQVMMYAVALYLGAFQDMDESMRDYLRLFSFIITTPVVFYSAQSFFKNAYHDLKFKRLGMDVPVALAIGGAYLASVWLTLVQGDHVYYDSVVMFSFFLLLGRFAENSLRQRIREQTDALSKLLPMTVTRWHSNEKPIETVLLSSVKTEELLLVKAGDIIPADGIIEKGSASINESLLTGESRPIKKLIGDNVLGGSINMDGELRIRVTATGQETLLSQIAYLLQSSQSEKPHLVKLADRIAAWFVLAILLIAIVTALYWWQTAPQDMFSIFSIVLSVLIVSCPCALSLATPVVLAVASSRFLKSGLLITKTDAIETLSRANSIVFDKTGTLTQGDINIIDTIYYGDNTKADCLNIAAALEQGSRHPIAAALTSANKLENLLSKSVTVDALNVIAGEGVEGMINGKRYRIGNKSFVSAGFKESNNDSVNEHVNKNVNENGTQVYLADNKELLCQFSLNDKPRTDVAATFSNLSVMGLTLHIASGDAASAVQEFVNTLPADTAIQKIHSRLKPADKLRLIKQLQSQGETVVMVGDGINDAPVLAAADVSIAMNSGTSLAQSAAGIILLGEKLSPIGDAVQLSRQTRSIIKQNILWALFYNATAIPLAASGFIQPWMAAIGMSLSSLLVLINAMRLSNAKIKDATLTINKKLTIAEASV